MNLYDLLVYKKMNSSGGGDIDVESLSVTENGSYNAGEGKAYNPVIVNVPEPTLKTKSITANGIYQASGDNADGYSSVDVHVEGYKITDVENLPASVASFQNGEKNLFTLDLATIKTLNTRGTWNDNVYTTNVSGGNQNVYIFSEDSVTLNYNGSEDRAIDLGSVQLEAGTYDFSGWTSPLGTTRIGLKQGATSTLYIPTNYHMATITFDEDVTINITFWPKGLSGKTGTWTYKPTVHHAGVKGGSALPMPKLKIAVEPQQDLHGYDHPWVGGAGKNKLEVTATSQTINGVTFTVNDDGTIRVNGTATADADLWLKNRYGSSDSFVGVGDYIANCLGCRSGVQLQLGYATTVYRIIENENDALINVTNNGISWVLLRISSGTVISTPIVIKPMIRLSSVSDATFAPYSNICPIIGWDEAVVTVADDVDNPTTTETITIQLGDTYYGGTLDVVSGVLSAVPYYASYNGEALVGEWISDRDKYEVGTTPTIGAQVVNIGATPTTIQLTPTQVNSLLGVNNVWADTGNIINATYIRDLNITINNLINA